MTHHFNLPAKAHQRAMREKIEAEICDPNGLAGGPWKIMIDTDISKAQVKEISRAEAKEIIIQYEWLGCMPAVVWHSYGIFFDGHCGGVVCYGPEYSENLGKIAREQGRKCADWSKYGYEGKMILLSRGACTFWAHPHAGSKLIRGSMKLLPEKFEVVTCTCDPAAGEIGTIYQAAGFFYVGSMRASRAGVKSGYMDRHAWMIDGKIVGPRSIRAQCGNITKEAVLAAFPDAVKVRQHSKHRYFAFRGSAAVQKAHRQAIEHLIKPFPKRVSDQ